MKKRILALLLVLSMLVSMVPTVFAADADLQPAVDSGSATWRFWAGGFNKIDNTHAQKFTSTSAWISWQQEGCIPSGNLNLNCYSIESLPQYYDFQAEVRMGDPYGYISIFPEATSTAWDTLKQVHCYRIVLSQAKGLQVGRGTSRGYSYGPNDATYNNCPTTMDADTWYILRYQVADGVLSVKMWEKGTTEPENWNIVVRETERDDYEGKHAEIGISGSKYFLTDYHYDGAEADAAIRADRDLGSQSKYRFWMFKVVFTTPVSMEAEIADSELIIGDKTIVSAVAAMNEALFGSFDATKVTYASNDEEVVTVNGNEITAVGAGETTITATYTVGGNSISVDLPVKVSEPTYVAKIGTQGFETFAAAMDAAKAMTGDVVVDIYGEVEFVNGMELNGNYTSITFNGKTANAKMTINQAAGGDYLEAHGKTVAFNDLILAKANPAWSGNSGHMGNYFSIQGGTVAYTRCTFPNGACTSGGTAGYNNCTFQNASEYGLWVYDDALVTVNGGIINSKKGIKVYSEDENSVTSTLTVQNATFTENVTAKPAVAIGYAESITLIGNTYNNPTDVLELDSGSDADCEGITFVAKDSEGNDIASTLTAVDRSNGNAPCGVLMDGKIYTSVTEAAKAVASGSTVTLLSDITITENWDCRSNGAKFTVPVTIDGKGHTIKLTGNVDDKNWNTVFRFEDEAIVKNLTIDASEATGIQRGITAKGSITVESCIIIGNNDTGKYGVIFGEGAGSTIGSVAASIINSKFVNWSNGVSDNQNGQDAKSVSIIDSEFENAGVLISAKETVSFTGNTVKGKWVNISSYSKPLILKVIATGNDLEANVDERNSNKIDALTAVAQEDFIVTIPLNYVSIGDSMANGYCFEGYEQGEEDNIDFFAGEGVYGEGAYPLQFEEWLEEQGNLVNHTKLAPSAMRAEDLNFLLGGREMPNDDWYDEVNGYTEVYDNEKLKEFFQTAVTDADIITMGVGNASFGAYMLHRVTDALGVLGGNLSDAEKVTLEQALVGLDEEQKSIVLEVYNTMMAQLKAYVPAELAEQFHVEDICSIVAYTVAGFILNYEGSLEQIVALNPDVEVILVGLMNTTYGMEITGEGVSVPVGDIMDEVFGALNAYIAALPAVKQANGEWTDATFYYAEQPNPKFISQEFDTLKNNNWGTVDRLDGQTVRERNISAYNGSLREIISRAFDLDLPEITLEQVAAMDNGRWASNDPMAYMSTAIYLGIEDAVAASTETMEIPLASLLTIATDIGSVFEGLNLNLQGDIRAQLGAYLTDNDVMKGMCKIYALFKVGNGMSVHPTPAGHDEIADAVIAAYENGYTAEDATKDNIEEYAKKALWLVTEYYDDVYAIVYDKLDEQGYVAASVAALEYVKAQISAIDVNALELSDAMKAELKEEAALAMEAIEALQNLLLTADELDDETVKAAQALLDDLTDALENMNDILAVAGTDLESAVKHQLSVLDAAVRAQISAAIERAETALENLKKYIDEDIAPAVRAEIEELIETIEGQLEYLQAVVDGTVEATIDQINKALAALEQAVTDLIKAAQNEADQLLQAMLDELKALAEATVAEFEAALYEATHISMSIYDDQYYVSLGGATANGAGVGRTDKIYSDLVVEALEAEGIDVEFKDLTKADLAYDGLVDYVKANAAEIAKATLITYNMDASGFLMSLFGNDPDWSAYFDEAEVKAAIEEIQAEVLALQSKLAAELDAEALAALAQAEDDVLAALTEQIDLDTAKEIAPYAEKLLYAAVSYAVETAKALEAIQAINPEAEIMLVGMYNPLAGTTVTVKGEVINLGEIVEYAMEATDLYHLIYAVANDKVAFVDVSETTVDGLGNLNVDDPKTMINSLAAALMNASAKISANAAGHAYIAEQIIGAIDFVGMLGDINLDGEVDTADAVAAVDAWLGKIELNELQKNNGDVNFDGTVDAADAALIVDFWLGKIQSFEK